MKTIQNYINKLHDVIDEKLGPFSSKDSIKCFSHNKENYATIENFVRGGQLKFKKSGPIPFLDVSERELSLEMYDLQKNSGYGKNWKQVMVREERQQNDINQKFINIKL